MTVEIKCSKCRERLAGFAVPAEQAMSCRHWSKEDQEGRFILARGTTIRLVKPWRQEKRDVLGKKRKRASRWLVKHDLRISTTNYFRNDVCVGIRNCDNNSADEACLCNIPEDAYELGGPGAQAHIEEDRVPLLEIRLEEEKKARAKAEAEAEELAIARRIDGQLARFEKLGIKARRSSSFPGMRSRSISMNPDEIERVLLTLERYVEMMDEKKQAEAEGEAEADTTTH